MYPVLKSLIPLSALFSSPVLQWPQIFFFRLPPDQTGAVLFGADFLASIFWRLVFYRQLKLKQDIWTRSNYYKNFCFRVTWKNYIKIVAQY